MNVSLNWLSSYIDLAGLGTQEMADMLTFAGIEVEGIQERGVTTDLVVVAQVMEKTPVEGSDHLNVCMVDAGEGSLRQIVCGAQNYKVGDKVPCALPGAVLPGGWEIKDGKLRGVESRGMLCSASELGLPDKEHGLWILPQDYVIGTPVRTFVETDTIFELEITPNRPDLLSHWGMARELAGITGRSLKQDPAEAPAAAAQTKDTVRQGLVTMTGTFIDTIIICTLTGLSLVVTGVWQGELNGAAMTDQAFSSVYPEFGSIILMVGLVLFAFTTILGWNYYGERCVEYLMGVKAILPYRIIFVGLVACGPFLKLEAIWILADIVNGLMAIPNLIALLALTGVVVSETKAYLKHLEENKK